MELDKISVDDFETHFIRAKSNMILIHKLREELKREHPRTELENNDKEIIFLAKQIENKYDNIIEKYIEERNILSEKLKSVQNKKKIANYSR